MMKISIKYFFYFALIGFQLFSQNYLWPTNASNYLTSSFCEYRPRHYHSAIDIKTWNKEGYPIYAVEDGAIYKIRVSPFGYGKVIYLKLKDGNYAVYAHLQKFSKALDEEIREKQLANQKYRVNWYPKNKLVKKGEIIGYTGSTGIGVPHLHFEIRNSKEQPLNPLVFYPQVEDNIRPRLQKIAVISLGVNSYVNKSYLPQVLDLTYIKDGIYIIKQPIKAKGNIGLAIKGFDQADGVHNKFAFYQTTLEISGSEVFQITYDKMDFASTGYIDTEIYYPLQYKFKEVFHKLYVEPFNILPFYTQYNTTDIINVIDSPVSFSIVVKDFHGNTSKIVGEIQSDENETIDLQQKFIKDNWVYLKFKINSFNFLSFSCSHDLQEWQPVNYYEILDRKSENPGHTLFTKIKITDSTAKYLRIETKSYDDIDVYHTISIASVDSSINPILSFSDKKLIIESTPSTNIFKIQSNSKIETLPALQDINGKSQIAIPISRFQYSDFKLGYENGDSTKWIDPKNLELFYPDKATKEFFLDSSVFIQSGYNSFFDTTLIQVKKSILDTLNINIPYLDMKYEVYPEDIALLNGVSIFIPADSLNYSPKWGVYSLNGVDKISFVSSHYDSQENGFIFRTKSLGSYFIAQDTLPPVLKIESPVENNTYQGNPIIKFVTYDDHSGIENEENIRITVDSLFVLPEWDPEEKTVIASLDDKLSTGMHIICIEVLDLAGNLTKDEFSVFIK
jgi:hypothetical protein